MRIGIDIRLQNESGVGRYIRNLLYWLAKIDKKNEYVLFSQGTWNRENRRRMREDKKWKMVQANLSWHSISEQLAMPCLLKKERLDLVHFPYFNVPIFYPGKFLVTIHDLIIDHFETGRASTLSPLIYGFKRVGYKLIMKSTLSRAEKIIVPSKATKYEVLEHYEVEPEKVVVIYEGADEDIKYQIANIKNTNQKSKIFKKIKPKEYFLYVGNAYPHKNLERLLEAFFKLKTKKEKVKTTTKNLKLVLVGREDFFYKGLKKQMETIGLGEDVIFTGYVSDEELGWLYQNAVALVIPSWMEGFSLPALEAMANGCLVLASDIPAFREICGEEAVYFNPKSVEEISEELYKSYTTYKTNRTYIEKGFARAKIFSWEKMVRETLKVYESCFNL